MNLIVCLDDNNGMCFNKRRQSRDRAVCERICDYTQCSKVWMDPYSEILFSSYKINVASDAQYLEKAGPGEYCFAEIAELDHIISRIEGMLVFRWNRKYPADTYFPKEILNGQFRLVQTQIFPGHSHSEITLEVYTNA